MARVTHRAVPPLIALEAEETPVLAETGATATAARCAAMATRNCVAQASSARSGEIRASRSAVRATEGRGALRDAVASRRESPNMRSLEAWARKRMGETHASQRRRTAGATGARKSDAAATGRHAALHARALSDGEVGGDGQESAVGTPVAPTA
eukprot:3589098-Pleurochrysis_carterae.AAC.2